MNRKNNLDEILYGIVCVIASWVFGGYLVMFICKILS